MAPAAKRPRRSVFDASEFAAGAIRRITLHNFMSYSDAELLDPGPRLNCIVGPNGTGKSSIVNALAIGLGGTLKLTERGSSAEDAIKTGSPSGFVEIELRDANGAGRPLVVRCDLQREGGRKVEYSLDGKRAPLKDVKERMASLGIQIDNMLQFLPQDKVAAFTQMKPTELLLNTLKATLPSAHAEHAELVRVSAHAAELAAERSRKANELDKALKLQDAYQGEVDALHALQALQKQVHALEGKRAWRAAFALADEADAKKARARATKEARKAAEKAAADAAQPAARAEALLRESSAAKKGAAARCAELKARAAAATDDVASKLMPKFDELEERLTQAEQTALDRRDEAARADAALARARSDLAALPQLDEAGVRASIAAIDADARAARAERGDAEEAMHAAERRARAVENHAAALRQQLKMLDDQRLMRHNRVANDRDGGKALELARWIKENHTRFEAEVIGPIGLSCDALDAQGGRWLENAIPKNVLLGVLCISRRDRDTIMRYVVEHRLNTSVYCFDRARANVRPKYDAHTDELRRLGVLGWLSERLSAPQVVHDFLCDFSNLSAILTASEQIGERMPAFEQLQRASNRESYTLFSPSTQFKASTSRYGNKKQTVSTTKFRAPRDGSLFFGDAAAPDPAERARLAEQLDADVAALDGARADMETAKAAMHDADAAVAELRSRKVAATGQASATAKARARVAELEQRARAAAQAAEPARVQREQSVVRADIDKLLDRLAAKATELARAHAAHADEAIELQCAALGARCAAEAVAEVTERAAAAKEALDAAARAEEMARKSKADAEARVVAAVNAATALAPDFAAANPKGFALSGEAKETWEAMPDNDDAIADELEHVNRKLSTSTADASALRRFEANAKAIDDLQRALEAFESEAQGQAHELARRRAAWEPKVREMAEHISAKFSEFFAAFNCVGEVVLHAPAKMEEYALQIRVKWRPSEELHTLSDGGRDSGGERSVATMVYLIALQDVNPCPFRIVDEINQAMDPTNERRIFECITRAVASQRSRTQYFLITPKLLPDLHYSEQTAVHFIYNGPYMQPNHLFDVGASAEHGGDRSPSASPDDEDS
ncbi:hypothetical protein KFE25_007889 [Diacronema lutheri]|uniref:Structural maintenance of chromosomes protein 5 n=1 Tax=Diacronema lutheri TaxID=2081491 RepID=A0A8J5XW13_DIALT|nr:hypothetical protein KFE25_007889 [Diacronema lutheri]